MFELSRFLGMIIAIYYKEIGAPHFHARYGEYRSVFAIDAMERIEGNLPRRAEALVLEWAAEHRQELQANWELAQAQLPLRPIPGLD